MGRTINSLKNIKMNMFGQVLMNIMGFICRTVFIKTLGKEYLGISSLYGNILLLLSVSELGFSNAVTYSLYRPLAENDTDKIASLMCFFRKAYRVVGLVILGLGLILLPFLPVLMNGTTDKVNIYLYYLLYLFQTATTYFFFSYKQVLLLADQKRYVADKFAYSIKGISVIAQIICLLVYPSFFIYTLIGIGTGVAVNLIVSIEVDRRYPYIKGEAKKLPKSDIKAMFEQVYASFLNRVCNIVGQATDNLIISSNINVLMVGLYDNYAMIVAVFQNILSNALHAFNGSLGNLYATEGKEKNEKIFRSLNLLNLWFVIFTSVCFLVIFQPFITLWIGEEYLFDKWVVFIIVMNYATNNMQGVTYIFRQATGLFVVGKYRPVASVISNLVLSLVMVRSMGVGGVFLASIISRMSLAWWYDAWVVYKKGFEKSPLGFYADSVMAAIWITMLSAAIQWMTNWMGIPVSWIGLIARGFICAVVVNLVLLLWYGRREEFNLLKEKGMEILRRKMR